MLTTTHKGNRPCFCVEPPCFCTATPDFGGETPSSFRGTPTQNRGPQSGQRAFCPRPAQVLSSPSPRQDRTEAILMAQTRRARMAGVRRHWVLAKRLSPSLTRDEISRMLGGQRADKTACMKDAPYETGNSHFAAGKPTLGDTAPCGPVPCGPIPCDTAPCDPLPCEPGLGNSTPNTPSPDTPWVNTPSAGETFFGKPLSGKPFFDNADVQCAVRRIIKLVAVRKDFKQSHNALAVLHSSAAIWHEVNLIGRQKQRLKRRKSL